MYNLILQTLSSFKKKKKKKHETCFLRYQDTRKTQFYYDQAPKQGDYPKYFTGGSFFSRKRAK